MTATIEPRELFERVQQGAKVVDVRTPGEFDNLRVIESVNFPLNNFDPKAVAKAIGLRSDEEVYLICKMGGRSQKACDHMIRSGFTGAVNVAGGTDAWVAAQLPAIRGKQGHMAINRQVQILAGGLVLLSAGISLYYPAWAGLSAFVGAGLVFAGLTDMCLMGGLLSKMSWNQASKPLASTRPNRRKPVEGSRPATSPADPSATTAESEDVARCDSGG